MTPELRAALEGAGIRETGPDGKPDPWFVIMSSMGRTLDAEDAKRLCAEVRNAVAVGMRDARRVEWGRAVAIRVACQVVTFAAGIMVGVVL